ncbi:MAG TPA: type I-C CRISPR-associated protein Cas8c/Csd1 [Acidobacteriaceae bacterium]|nr:type I-C CRISPR-associated protein Cas8c/Csd1 [Acidobacteriaceae bacterium]
MILQELARYYERKTNDPETALAPEGFEKKEIPFVLVIDKNGGLVQIEDTRSGDGKKKRARSFLVPQGVKKASGVAANLLWDTAEYVLGIDTKGKPERVVRQHAAFLARLAELLVEDEGVRSVRAFLASMPLALLEQSPSWEEIRTTNPNLSFQLASDTELVCQRDAVVTALRASVADEDSEPSNASRGICLISGKDAEIVRLHTAIKGVWGAQTSGANIVSFNLRAFESYGKEEKQGENAPISKHSMDAYTKALNHLLGKDSTQRIQVGDASTVFWASAKNFLEGSFSTLLGEPPKDNPDSGTRAVKALYESVQQGSQNVNDETTQFFVLGLAPNAARISIRFWLAGTVKDFSCRIVEHFDDIAIDHAPYEPPYPSLFRLLASTALQGKAENIPPSLGGDTMRAILSGLPYPETLLLSAIRRIRAEQEVSYPRAALIKACINRKTRRAHPAGDSAPEEELHVSLDLANTNVGYRLGRLFAALEKVQEEASPGLNATIRDRFYGAASSTPVTVFSNLLKLSKHHLAKIENRGRAVNLEKLIGEIVDALNGDEGFTAHLTIADQGRFAIGYYHQKQAFYAKKSEPSEGVQA